MTVQSNIVDKKDSILRSTLELIKDNGFHRTPISLIAKKAGVAAGTIYHYFPSKDAIIFELHQQIKNRMVEEMLPSKNNQVGFKERFFAGWIGLCKYFIANPYSLIFIEQFNSSPYAKMANQKDSKATVNKFSEFFKSGMNEGYVKQMEYGLVASVVFGCIIATARYHIGGRFDFKDKDLCSIANILWDGIKTTKK
jgi:AcrR family transcriptional regulator